MHENVTFPIDNIVMLERNKKHTYSLAFNHLLAPLQQSSKALNNDH
jgi:hypothetical protein